ncbi:MAG: hypothetical protein AAF959_06780 [Cyanobacteria bacterium P01_D01_bin.56]
MASQCIFYPLRGVIRCLAKSYLTVASETGVYLVWDEPLFSGLSSIVLNPTLQPLLASPCSSRNEAVLIEDYLARLLANIYRRILRQRHEDTVQQLNSLL